MTMQSLQPGYLSLKHAATWADVSPKTVQRWIAAGLPVYQATAGGKVLVRPVDIEHFLQKRQVPQVDIDAMVNETLSEMELGKGSRPTGGKGVEEQPLSC